MTILALRKLSLLTVLTFSLIKHEVLNLDDKKASKKGNFTVTVLKGVRKKFPRLGLG